MCLESGSRLQLRHKTLYSQGWSRFQARMLTHCLHHGYILVSGNPNDFRNFEPAVAISKAQNIIRKKIVNYDNIPDVCQQRLGVIIYHICLLILGL